MLHTQIVDLICKEDNFAIVSHVSPDGDNVGSMLGLYNTLIDLGKNVDMFIDDPFPQAFSFLPKFNEAKHSNGFDYYSCLFILDCGDLDRLGKCRELTERCKTTINIDHHISNKAFAHINLIDTEASSTGELILQVIKCGGFKISKDIASCLYTSILTDTGGFKYSNTTPITLNAVGELIDTGIDFTEIYSSIYDRKTVGQVRLISKVASTLEIQLNSRVAVLSLSRNMLIESGALEEDSNDMINIGRDIDGVEVAIFIKEKEKDVYKISLRSKKYIDVRKIAERFGGGGHVRAAGCTIEGSLENVKKKVIDEIIKIMDVKE
jgi:phosphoesterase RecJ-like protein